MLYVFQMDIGQMLTFDMTLLMDTVARLQTEIFKTTGISVDHQILLLSGGQSLKPDQKVMTYGAGADTNPVFLFSKLAIENQDPPVIKSVGNSKDALNTLKERVMDVIKLKPTFETVNLRAQLANQIRDSASSIYAYCKGEFQEQHLQHQGWGAVIANLEEIADALQKTQIKLNKAIHTFLPCKENYFKMLEGFEDVLNLIGRIPLLDSLKESFKGSGESSYKSSDKSLADSFHEAPSTLLEWICSQAPGQGIRCLHQKCEEDMQIFNDNMLELYDKQVHDLLSAVRMDPTQMKELVGIERRLSELEKRLNEAKRIATTQSDLAHGFAKHKSTLGSLPDAAGILPDLCESHKQHLFQMLDCQQRMLAVQNNFRNSKQEMSRNIHQRLSWVMHVETKIAKLDSELIFHIKAMKVLECNLDLLGQIKVSPSVYAELVVETVRRRQFAEKFSHWAEVLEEDSNLLYKSETDQRKVFSEKYGSHFLLHTMFRGFEDRPPNITTKVPRLFASHLPEITHDEIISLKSLLPELEDSFSSANSSCDLFPHDLLDSRSADKTPVKSKLLNLMFEKQVAVSQKSHTPSIVTATDGPVKPFTIPEEQGPESASHNEKASSTTETATKDAFVDTHTLNVGVDKSCQEDSPIKTITGTQTSITFPSGEIKNDCKTIQSVSEINGALLAREKVMSALESSSLLSSTEFATADYYFEEPMPSPLDSSTEKQSRDRALQKNKPNEKTIEPLDRTLKQESEFGAENVQNEAHAEVSEISDEQLEFFSLIGTLENSESSQREAMISEEDVNKTTSAFCQTDSCHSMNDRVNDLEEKLEKLTLNLDQSHLSLMKAEEALRTVQEQEQAVHDKDRDEIDQLQKKIAENIEALEEAMTKLHSKEKEISTLNDSLQLSHRQQSELETQLKKSSATVGLLQNKLKDVSLAVSKFIPSFREEMSNVKSLVAENMSQVDLFRVMSVNTFENEVLPIKMMLSNLEEDKLHLSAEVIRLEEELKGVKIQNENELSSIQAQLNSAKEDLVNEKDLFSTKYAEQKQDFDCALQDLETKHALEMEIEIDKCKAQMQETLAEWEQKYEEEKQSNCKLLIRLSSAEESLRKAEEDLEGSNRSKKELEADYKAMSDRLEESKSENHNESGSDKNISDGYISVNSNDSLQDPKKDLSVQIEKSQETIVSQEDRIKTLTSKNEELKRVLKCFRQGVPVTQNTFEAVLEESVDDSLMQTSALNRSFIQMEQSLFSEQSFSETDEMKLKDQKIANLEKHLMEVSISSGKDQSPDKISFRGCDIGDLVLLCLDEKHDQYVVFTVGTNLHFLHSESLEALGLKSSSEPSSKKPWILAKVMDKEYCLAKKPNNRFRVPQGTCFYRVKCHPWKCDVDLTRHRDVDASKQKQSKSDQANVGSKTKKTEQK